MIKAGVAIKDITPKEPLFLAGYPEPADRFGNTVHDPLYCSAYYLGDKDEIIMICLDLCNVTKKQTREIREGINKATGVKKENISVSCTHTHSGPTTTSRNFNIYNEDNLMYPAYMASCVSNVIDTATEAYNTRFDARVGYGSAICGKAQNIGGNRHYKDGPADEQVFVISIKDTAGRIRGIITSYSLHPTLLHADSFAYSADFPGYMREYFSKEYPGSIFGFQMGTSGNQSSRHFRTGQNFEEAKRYGYTLGAAANEAIQNIVYRDDLEIKVTNVWVDALLKDIPTAQAAAENATTILEEYKNAKAGGMNYADLRTLECKLIGSNAMANVARQLLEPGAREAMMAAYPFQIQAFRLGELVILFSAGELFVELGLEIKQRSLFKDTYVASNSNGTTLGYICTPKAHEDRTYEAQGTLLRPEMAKRVVDKALEAIALVK
jgi:neutral ceramidase